VNRSGRTFSANKLRETQRYPLLVKLGIPRGGCTAYVTVLPVRCAQTGQHQLWCSVNCDTMMRESRRESTVTSMAISRVMLSQMGLHGLPTN